MFSVPFRGLISQKGRIFQLMFCFSSTCDNSTSVAVDGIIAVDLSTVFDIVAVCMKKSFNVVHDAVLIHLFSFCGIFSALKETIRGVRSLCLNSGNNVSTNLSGCSYISQSQDQLKLTSKQQFITFLGI